MSNEQQIIEYGISKAGAVTKDGRTMFIEDIVKELNRKAELEKELSRQKGLVEAMSQPVRHIKADAIEEAVNSVCLIAHAMSRSDDFIDGFAEAAELYDDKLMDIVEQLRNEVQE